MTRVLNGVITNLETNSDLDEDDAALVAGQGVLPPTSTPVYVGQFYVDTSAKKLYFATGTSSSADWTIAN